MSEEEALYLDLENRVKEALKEFSLEEVLGFLYDELQRLETTNLRAIQDGIGSVQYFERLSMLIRITKRVIAKLENGEIKPPPCRYLQQVTLDGFIQKQSS
jgi:hypothetical protein